LSSMLISTNRAISVFSFSFSMRMILALSAMIFGDLAPATLAPESHPLLTIFHLGSALLKTNHTLKAPIVPLFRFCHLRIHGWSARVFLARKPENLRYKKRCTFGLIFLERQPALQRRESKLGMTSFCTIEYGSTNTERRCGRAAVAKCADCGSSVCASCGKECCGKVLCGYCYDYHAIHSCLKSSAPTELRPVPVAFRPAPHHDAL
jgi:hypothetical protein